MPKNDVLHKAKEERYDEYYTRFQDIEEELKYYWKFFKDKVIYCNCDDYSKSNFVKYFVDNFAEIGLKKLIATSYTKDGKGKYFDFNGRNTTVKELDSDGSFDSVECKKILLEEADIVVTNPPFSLFRDFVDMVYKYKKDLIVMGTLIGATYKDIFLKIMEREIFLGVHVNHPKYFEVGDGFKKESILKEIDGRKCVSIQNITWFTTFQVDFERVLKVKKKKENNYIPQKYDNYDAVNFDKLQDLQADIDEEIGVPISILKYLNPDGYIYVEYEE